MRCAYLASIAFAAGCVSNDADANVVILRNLALTDACVVGADPEGAFIAAGEVQQGAPYVFTPVVQNFATTVDGDEARRIAFIQGARIDISFTDETLTQMFSGSDLIRFQVPLSGSIEPGGTAGFAFEIVPPELSEMLQPGDLMLVDIRMFGRMDGGNFDGASFRYPVEICDDCGVIDLGDCATVPADYEPLVGHPCNPGQDGVTECCTRDTQLVCPASGTAL